VNEFKIGILYCRKFFPGKIDHGFGTVDPHNPAPRQEAGQESTDFAIAAPEIKQTFVTLQRHLFNQFARPVERGR